MQFSKTCVDEFGHFVGLQVAQDRTDAIQVRIAIATHEVTHLGQCLLALSMGCQSAAEILEGLDVVRCPAHITVQTAETRPGFSEDL